jgi:hypothetical protein
MCLFGIVPPSANGLFPLSPELLPLGRMRVMVAGLSASAPVRIGIEFCHGQPASSLQLNWKNWGGRCVCIQSSAALSKRVVYPISRAVATREN